MINKWPMTSLAPTISSIKVRFSVTLSRLRLEWTNRWASNHLSSELWLLKVNPINIAGALLFSPNPHSSLSLSLKSCTPTWFRLSSSNWYKSHLWCSATVKCKKTLNWARTTSTQRRKTFLAWLNKWQMHKLSWSWITKPYRVLTQTWPLPHHSTCKFEYENEVQAQVMFWIIVTYFIYRFNYNSNL